MPDYRRIYAGGGTYFLTVCLSDRRSDLLVRKIDKLRASWRDVTASRAFETVEQGRVHQVKRNAPIWRRLTGLK